MSIPPGSFQKLKDRRGRCMQVDQVIFHKMTAPKYKTAIMIKPVPVYDLSAKFLSKFIWYMT